MIGLEDNFLKEYECQNLIRIFSDWSVRSKRHRDILVLHLYFIDMSEADQKLDVKDKYISMSL